MSGLDDRIARDFAYHKPNRADSELIGESRDQLRRMAMYVAEITPAGREQSLAITALEEAMFWTSAAIARNSVPDP